MSKRMLIDASHAEETRVVVLDGSRLEDFDVETQARKQLKGNIYLAKVVRVEPSLQAAFVEYGGNRHGFLAFGEIHPDYYQIPVADRQRLLEMQEAEARAEEEAEDAAAAAAESTPTAGRSGIRSENAAGEAVAAAGTDDAAAATLDAGTGEAVPAGAAPDASDAQAPYEPVAESFDAPGAGFDDAAEATEPARANTEPTADQPDRSDFDPADTASGATAEAASAPLAADAGPGELPLAEGETPEPPPVTAPLPTRAEIAAMGADLAPEAAEATSGEVEIANGEPESVGETAPPPETIGGDSGDDRPERRPPPRFMRNYKIQEVIRRRQILLVQVVKEERGTKGAALTTYISLAGRYCVLMPNSPRGGGISRKITSAADRRRLKEITAELDIPRGMGLIVRTAGAQRPKPEIKRDCEYLLRLWDDIRERTLASVAPMLIYEEADLIKRAIRDVYSRDIDEVVVDGEGGWKAARDFMRMLMPSHARKVQLWRDGGQPLFAKSQVEAQLDGMLQPTVQLKSGGYLVINQTEALVAIDVNSGRSTRERGIEETALRTNLEAADEVSRQLRLRDLAGLIVIDFIDMESKKHNAMVERRLKEALKTDRARIQVGHISHFGLMEMSRQRLRPSLAETSFTACPHCGGTGHVRSTESSVLHVLRAIEEEGGKRRAAEIVVSVAGAIALYILNHKRARLADIEARAAMRVSFAADDSLIPPQIRIDRVRAQTAEAPPAIRQETATPPPEMPEDEAVAAEAADEAAEEAIAPVAESAEAEAEPSGEEGERRRRRRRRRRRGGRREDGGAEEEAAEADDGASEAAAEGEETGAGLADVAVEPAPSLAAVGDAPLLIAEAADGTAPSEAAAETETGATDEAAAAEESQRGRRRGRRGGRRRREGAEDEAAPIPAPPYAGPTPADPFGGHGFDIFDVIEQVAEREASAPMNAGPGAAPAAEVVTTAAPDDLAAAAAPVPARDFEVAASGSMAETDASPPPELSEPVPTLAHAVAAAPVVPPEPAPALITEEPETVQAPPPAEPAQPAIQPIMVGSEDAAAPKKRGWWRR
ncbi:MAG TPA: Rne/Rng family ribonuclease [Acetobacteraceae bacterium]|nr:Rne/Rng family ribonuclease [Acetobacteraceae bacterium]